MKIIPNSDILIACQHSPAGVVTETTPAIGLSLIAQGLAKAAPADPAPAIQTAEAPRPEVKNAALRTKRQASA